MSIVNPPKTIRVRTSDGWSDLAVQGPEGPIGPVGPVGPTGAQGNPGPGVATGGTTGQLLTKTSATDFATAWQNAPQGTPPGGITGDFLAKTSNTDHAVSWQRNLDAGNQGGPPAVQRTIQMRRATLEDWDNNYAHFVPAPGEICIGDDTQNSGYTYVKVGNENGNQWDELNTVGEHVWSWIYNRMLPTGGTTGQVLTKTSNNNYAVNWQTPTGASPYCVLSLPANLQLPPTTLAAQQYGYVLGPWSIIGQNGTHGVSVETGGVAGGQIRLSADRLYMLYTVAGLVLRQVAPYSTAYGRATCKLRIIDPNIGPMNSGGHNRVANLAYLPGEGSGNVPSGPSYGSYRVQLPTYRFTGSSQQVIRVIWDKPAQSSLYTMLYYRLMIVQLAHMPGMAAFTSPPPNYRLEPNTLTTGGRRRRGSPHWWG